MTEKDSAALFCFLAQSLQYPEKNWLTDSYFTLFEKLAQHLEQDHNAPAIRQQYHEDDRGLEILQTEYTRLFINHIPSVIAPPYSSIYLDSEAGLYGPSAVWVKQFYQQHGVDLAGEADIPDHLARELQFIALMLDDNLLDAAEQFLEQHLRVWFPRFKERVYQQSSNRFYRAILEMIDFFTRKEP